MRRLGMASMRITLLIAVALAAHASGDESLTLRATEGAVSPGFCRRCVRSSMRPRVDSRLCAERPGPAASTCGKGPGAFPARATGTTVALATQRGTTVRWRIPHEHRSNDEE